MIDVNSLILDRYSTVVFSTRAVEEDKLKSLFEAVRWAPSSYNEQPWRFIVGIKNKNEDYEKLFDCLADANQYWAKYAPILVLGLARKKSSVKDKLNRFAEYDTGMAVGNLLMQATSIGLYVHQMGGYDVKKIKEIYKLDEEFEPMSIMAIGYKGDISLFPNDLKERELKKRLRKPIGDILL